MAGVTPLHDITSEEFMRSVRINTLSYVPWGNTTQGLPVDHVFSAFIAVKHASLAMVKANPEGGKPYGGGSIVLVASGDPLRFPSESFSSNDRVSFSCWTSIGSRARAL